LVNLLLAVSGWSNAHVSMASSAGVVPFVVELRRRS
jgi:formylmethanofuran dehydrogenase subunit A